MLGKCIICIYKTYFRKSPPQIFKNSSFSQKSLTSKIFTNLLQFPAIGKLIALFELLLIPFQKQLFADVLQNRCSQKFRNNHRKTSVLESLFIKVAGLKACNFIKNKT